MDSDVHSIDDVHGGVFAYDIRPINDLHDANTNTAESTHYFDFTNRTDRDLSYSWKTRFILLENDEDDEVHEVPAKSDSGTISPGERVRFRKDMSMDVSGWRPGQVGFKARTRLKVAGEVWACADVFHPLYLQP